MSPGSHRRQPASPTGPTVVETGANSGIGFEGAQALAAALLEQHDT